MHNRLFHRAEMKVVSVGGGAYKAAQHDSYLEEHGSSSSSSSTTATTVAIAVVVFYRSRSLIFSTSSVGEYLIMSSRSNFHNLLF